MSKQVGDFFKFYGLLTMSYLYRRALTSWPCQRPSFSIMTYWKVLLHLPGSNFCYLQVSEKKNCTHLLWLYKCKLKLTQFEKLASNILHVHKAELPQEDILFRTQFSSLGIFINKKVSKKLRPPRIQLLKLI